MSINRETDIDGVSIMDVDYLQHALAGTAKVSEIARRDMFTPEAARGNHNSLWTTMASCIRVITRTFRTSNKSIQVFELEIRDVWYLFILAAKSIDAHHPAQDRLTRLILWARELGALTRLLKPAQTSQMMEEGDDVQGFAEAKNEAQGRKGHDILVQDAVTTDGRIWVDLPFMVQDIQDGWKNAMGSSTSSEHRCNLAAAIARLAGLGVRDEAFSGCGLDIMTQALETSSSADSRSSVNDRVEPDPAITAEAPLTVLQFLAVVQIWLRYSGDKILQLSVSNHPCSEPGWNTGASSPGQLARDAGVDSAGFSQVRFLFWKKRISDLKESEDEAVKEMATACSNIMTVL